MKFEELDRERCIDLLETQAVGRLAVTVDGEPEIFPVNYRFMDDTIVIRTDTGTKLNGATLGRVAFEIDHIYRCNRKGWSVVARGSARDISNEMDRWAVRLRGLALHPWAPGPKTHWLAIAEPVITGRVITLDSDTRFAPA